MTSYIFRRILYFIPTLVIISLLAFIISIQAPGDPVERLLNAPNNSGDRVIESAGIQKEKARLRQQLGLDLPVFYCSIESMAMPARQAAFENPENKTNYARLVAKCGNHELVDAYLTSIDNWYQAHDKVEIPSGLSAQKDSLYQLLRYSAASVRTLKSITEDVVIQNTLQLLMGSYGDQPSLHDLLQAGKQAEAAFLQMEEDKTLWKNFIPVIRWHANNQYHRWVFGDGQWITGKGAVHTRGIIRGDLGISYTTQLPVSSIIASRIRWSLFFTFVSVLLAYIISIPIGLQAASRRNSLFDRGSSLVLFMLYSLPTFWVATLLLMNFANPDVFKWFPASGVGPSAGFPEGSSWWVRLTGTLPYLILPTICYTYAQLAFLSRVTRVSTLEVLGMDYIRTARAKGVLENRVLYRHAFRNALLPIITVFSNIFPAAIGGSVILETVFSIPGMGREIIQAIYQQDYPVIISVFTITGVLTLIGYLVADILYAFADPRIQWKR